MELEDGHANVELPDIGRHSTKPSECSNLVSVDDGLDKINQPERKGKPGNQKPKTNNAPVISPRRTNPRGLEPQPYQTSRFYKGGCSLNLRTRPNRITHRRKPKPSVGQKGKKAKDPALLIDAKGTVEQLPYCHTTLEAWREN
jgi:hypothetical protein